MSKFVRIDQGKKPKEVVMLNLDLVAIAELSRVDAGEGEQWVNVRFVSAEQMNMGSLHFKTLEEANQWTLKHLGAEL
jgi:hypothetical protein